MIAAGGLNRRITIQQATTVQDAAGDPVPTWANLASVPVVWASREHVQGREPFTEAQHASFVDTKYRIRYRADLDPTKTASVPKLRVLDGRLVYDIVSVHTVGFNEALELMGYARGE